MVLTEAAKSELIAQTWNLEQASVVPYIIEIGTPHFATTDFYDNDQTELQWNESYNRDRLQINDFGIANIKPNIGIGVMAAAFGCESVVNDESDPWAKPLIRNDNISDVHKIKKPDLKSNPIYKKSIERLEYLQARTPCHLRLINVPSPLVTASLIWDYTSFILATMMHPREVHTLLEIVTEATIEFLRLQLETITNPVSMGHEIWHIPREVGIRISDDTAAVMSPNLYREFGVTYNTKISDAFGGIIVHSCGELKHVLPIMMEIPGLRGIDLSIPQNGDWQVVKESALNKTALILRYFYWDHPKKNIDSAEYTQRVVNEFGRRGIFILTSAPTLSEAIQLKEKIHPILA